MNLQEQEPQKGLFQGDAVTSESRSEEEGAEAIAPSTPPDPEQRKHALEEEEQKAQTYLSNWQRAQADLLNYKKRVEQERTDLVKFANAALLSQILPTLDDLERALEAADARLMGLTWIDGIRLIYRKLQVILEAQGIKEIPAVGEQFDPRFHEAALFSEGEEEGKILQEFQKGYMVYDRVLRPSMVKVGKGRLTAETQSVPEKQEE